jgi:hypothetical protein
MPVPTTIDDLSTTAASNSPAGSDTPADGDNFIRALSAFVAILRDKLDGTSASGTLTTPVFSGTPTGTVTSGTYTPTLTNTTNISASTSATCQYIRVGASVTVSGQLQMDPSAASALTQLGISLPVASTFASAGQCAGTASRAPTSTCILARIKGDTINGRAQLEYISDGSIGNDGWSFQFTYLIV